MGWIKLDDAFLDHPKYLEAGPLAGYLCICGIAWSNRNRTDGFIPRAQVKRLADFDGCLYQSWGGEMVGGVEEATPIELAETLVDCGLWEVADGGYRIHDYHDWQRSTEQIEADIEQRRQAGKRSAKRRQTNDSLNGSSDDSLNGSLNEALNENPNEISTRVPTEVRSKKEETTTPQTPRERGAVKFNGKTVPTATVDIAATVLADFNEQAGTSYTPFTNSGKPSESLKRILGAVLAHDLTPERAAAMTRYALTRPYWDGPAQPGNVFGPGVVERNHQATANTSHGENVHDLAARINAINDRQGAA